MQSLALDVNVVSEEGTRAEMGDEDDDLLRAAEELGIDLSGVRAGGDGKSEAADEQEEQIVAEDDASAGITDDDTDEYIRDPVDPAALAGNDEILAEADAPTGDEE
jgi:DNA-directed RNA polymerase subunit beta